MTTEKTPPPGKVWVTFETDHDVWDDPFAWDPKALVGNVPVKVERGENPETDYERFQRLITEAGAAFRVAAQPDRFVDDIPPALLKLAEAMDALRRTL